MDAGDVTSGRTSGTNDNASSTQVSALTLCHVTRHARRRGNLLSIKRLIGGSIQRQNTPTPKL